MKFFKKLSSFYIFVYTLKTKYRNLEFYFIFFPSSFLTIENLQNHFNFYFLAKFCPPSPKKKDMPFYIGKF